MTPEKVRPLWLRSRISSWKIFILARRTKSRSLPLVTDSAASRMTICKRSVSNNRLLLWIHRSFFIIYSVPRMKIYSLMIYRIAFQCRIHQRISASKKSQATPSSCTGKLRQIRYSPSIPLNIVQKMIPGGLSCPAFATRKRKWRTWHPARDILYKWIPSVTVSKVCIRCTWITQSVSEFLQIY